MLLRLLTLLAIFNFVLMLFRASLSNTYNADSLLMLSIMATGSVIFYCEQLIKEGKRDG